MGINKELRDKYVRLADQMRDEAVEQDNDRLLYYARRLTAMTNTLYESATNSVVEGYMKTSRQRLGAEEER